MDWSRLLIQNIVIPKPSSICGAVVIAVATRGKSRLWLPLEIINISIAQPESLLVVNLHRPHSRQVTGARCTEVAARQSWAECTSRPTTHSRIQGWAIKDFSVLNVMHCISKYTINGIFSMILNFNKPTILMKPKNVQLLFVSILKNKKASGHSHILLTSVRTCSSWLNSSSPGTHMLIRYGSMTPRGAHMRRFASFQSSGPHTPGTETSDSRGKRWQLSQRQRSSWWYYNIHISILKRHVKSLRLLDSSLPCRHWRPLPSPLPAPLLLRKVVCNVQGHCQTWPSICFVLTFGEHVHRNMKHQCSMRRLTITGGSEKTVRVSRGMDYPFVVIKYHVSANNKNLFVAWLMCHVYKFMFYSFVELKLKINTRSLFNRALNPAHPTLPSGPLLALAWVYSLGMVSRYSTVRSRTLTWREWGLWSIARSLEQGSK